MADDDDSADQLQEAALEAIGLIRDEVTNLFARHGETTPDATPTLKMLFWYLSSRSQAVSMLVSHAYPWDAEIVLRSFYETAAKILLLCFTEGAEKTTLVDEFWNRLGPIHARRTARKAAVAEKVVEPGSLSASVFGMLQDGSVFGFETEGSKAERKRLEQKWSFGGIIERLSLLAPGGRPLTGITSFHHVYGMASHLAHGDSAAMDLMADRATRPRAEHDILAAGHLARIVTDQASIFYFCAEALRSHFGAKFENRDAIRQAYHRTMALSARFVSAFDASQRDFYASWAQREST